MALALRFLFIGPQKTGSAWLRSCLRQHPEVCLPQRVNETFFFDRYFARGIDWYAEYFAPCPEGKVLGEVAPTYFAVPDVASRVRFVCPEALIITSLRNPIDRAWSMYRYLRQKGDTRAPFRQAVDEFPNILEDGLYAKHLTSYREQFADSQIMNLVYEDVIREPNAALAQVFHFLQVDDTFVPGAIAARVNEGRSPRFFMIARLLHRAARELHRRQMHEIVQAAKSVGLKNLVLRPAKPRGRVGMPEADRLWCVHYFREDVEKLSRILHRDLSTLWFGTSGAIPQGRQE